MKNVSLMIFAALTSAAVAQQTPSSADRNAILERTKAATVIVLAGEGGGRLRSIATGVIVSPDGVILTALHAIKDAAEVQVRTSAGETYDQVQLLGSDERRDVAALKISAGALPALKSASGNAVAAGDPVYAVTNANGLSWSATDGIVSALRQADEVPGAGSGFRLIQFSAPVASGSSGGALVDRNGAVIGIITGSVTPAGFAVPVESVLGLADSGHRVNLGAGAALQMPAQANAAVPQSSAAVADSDPKQILKNARTISIRSKTSFFTVDTLLRALAMNKQWPSLGIKIVQDDRVADLFITLDRPLFTYIHTFVITDKRTSIVLGAGKVTAFDGNIASGDVAKNIVKIFADARATPAVPKAKQ